MSHASLPKVLSINHRQIHLQSTPQSSLAEVLQSDQVKRLLNRPNIVIESVSTRAYTNGKHTRSAKNGVPNEKNFSRTESHPRKAFHRKNVMCIINNDTQSQNTGYPVQEVCTNNERHVKNVTSEISISMPTESDGEDNVRILPSKSSGQSEIALLIVKPEQKDCDHQEACENIVCDVAVQRYVDHSGVLPMLAVCIEDDEINAPVSKHCQNSFCDALSIDHSRCRRALVKLYRCDSADKCDICGIRLKTRRARISHKTCVRKDIYRHNETDGAQVLREKMREREFELVQAARMKKKQPSDPVSEFKKTMESLKKNKELIVIPKTPPPQLPVTVKAFNINQTAFKQSNHMNMGQSHTGEVFGKLMPNLPMMYPQQGVILGKRANTECNDAVPLKQSKVSISGVSLTPVSVSSSSHATVPQFIQVSTMSQPNSTQPVKLNEWFASQTRLINKDSNDMKPYLTPIRVVPITKLQTPPSLYHRTHGIPAYCLVPDTSAKPIPMTNFKIINSNVTNLSSTNVQTAQIETIPSTPAKPTETIESDDQSKVSPNLPSLKPKTRKNTQRRRSEERSGKSFKCPYCLKGFSTDWYFKMHVAGHKGEMLFSCKTCEKPFSNRYDMKKHVLNDHDDGECKCEWCGHISLCKSALEIHVRSHTGEKPFSCTECQSSYRSSTDLKTHQRKRHDYIDCFYCFSQMRRLDLEDHLITAHRLTKEEALIETTSHDEQNKSLDDSSDNLEIITDPSDAECAANESSKGDLKQDQLINNARNQFDDTGISRSDVSTKRKRRFYDRNNPPSSRNQNESVTAKTEVSDSNTSGTSIRAAENNAKSLTVYPKQKRIMRKKSRRTKPRRKCRVCGILFRTGALLQDHLASNPKETVECPDCKKLFHTQIEYADHNATYQSSCRDSRMYS